MKIYGFALLILLLLTACGNSKTETTTSPTVERSLTIAAAANLEPAFTEIGKDFQSETGIKPIFSYGATGMLAKQIDNGAPFDLFAAADVKTVDKIESNGEI